MPSRINNFYYQNKLQYYCTLFLMETGKFENIKYEYLNIKYWSWWARKRETIMIWKKLITVDQSFQRDWLEKGKKQSDFPLRMDSYITRRAELSSQLRIAKSTSFMISTKGQAILVTQKQCQLILGEPQHTKKILLVSFHIKFTTMLRTTYKNVIVVKDKIVCHQT